MLIFAIDDEPKMLRLLHRAIEEAQPEAQIRDFSLGTDALEAIKKEMLAPYVIFTDIQMPKLDGLELALRLKALVPNARIVFVTGYDEYAIDAYRLHVNGYVMKPVDAERIKEEIAYTEGYKPKASDKLEVRCFGSFEVFFRGEPLIFSRHKTKELFAWLIDRRGVSCTADEVITSIYEGTTIEDMKRVKQNLRNLISDLKGTLQDIGMEGVILRKGSTIAVRTEKIECDYYRMLEGDMSAVIRLGESTWSSIAGQR